ncbi:MAG: hypothetical protein O2968_06000, partial [Acidobacteria bacterium]|nr:hypothetical protein [Acidobacteriota bacterium]
LAVGAPRVLVRNGCGFQVIARWGAGWSSHPYGRGSELGWDGFSGRRRHWRSLGLRARSMTVAALPLL